ncbi:hypothetical protein JI747_020255 [Chryseobacterium sp. RG1]|uniref:S9 family peptidase n=1 Tax=Chryseobacterium tagetis TaxID=2801334 RepID=A0ABS8A699_9FLAO|nr:hypothetical protein [Chryseobacterium tagetis]MCA6069499.1 hypothetical protein [Chryseobacterium tagetis]
MKKYLSLYFILFTILSFSQDSKLKEYCYKAPRYYECINLLKDGSFKYYRKTEFLKEEIYGNWQVKNDSLLVLDSNPQRSRLIVNEIYKKGKKITFNVRDSEQRLINYHLYIIRNKKDTIAYKDQFDKTIVTNKEKGMSFYIVNTAGLHSPEYKFKSNKANYFNVTFEQKRIFENEQWKFKGNKIVPLNLDGKYSNYELK